MVSFIRRTFAVSKETNNNLNNIIMRHLEILSFCRQHGFNGGRKNSLYEVVERKFEKGDMRAYYVALSYPDYFDFVNK